MHLDTKDARLGLYEKFKVERTDGRSAAGEKHHGCEYFVLDLSHDPFAYKALAAYARACGDEYPALADDLRAAIGRMAEWMIQRRLDSMTPEEQRRFRNGYWEYGR